MRGIAGQAAGLAQGIELGAPAGEDLVGVGLVPGINPQHVVGRVEHPVRGDGQPVCTQVRVQAATDPGDRVDQERPDFLRQGRKLRGRRCFEIGGAGDAREQAHAGHTPWRAG